MFNTRQTILASRPAAMVLALTLVAGLSAPFLLLPRANAAAGPPPVLPCTEGNHNGCTELSATPPEDTVSVPPNIVLMLDDSGSMEYDYMPDWGYLSNTSDSGVRNSDINGIYYNPLTEYTPPPQADGTPYPDSSFPNAFRDGFTDRTNTWYVPTYSATTAANNGHPYDYGTRLPTTEVTYTDQDYGPAVWGGGTPGSPGSPGSPGVPAHCPTNYYPDTGNPGYCLRNPVSASEVWTCPAGYNGPTSHGGNPHMCYRQYWDEGDLETDWVNAIYQGYKCPGGTTGPDAANLCHYPSQPEIPATPPTPPTGPTPPTPDYKWTCPSGGSTNAGAPAPPSPAPRCKSRSGSRKWIWAFTYIVGTPARINSHFVIPRGSGAPSDGWCAHMYPGGGGYWNGYDTRNCVNEDDVLGTAAPSGVQAGHNIANWFSYYRTRMLMAKSGLMIAFTKLDPLYRFGFASINGNGKNNIPNSPSYFTFDDSGGGGGDPDNRLAVVQPYGVGSDSSSQRTKFWNWLDKESPNKGTPLRKALQAAGEYYQTAQPWKTMPGDPGYTATSTTKFSCRASYTILTTDGFWNGGDPTAPAAILGAADNNGPLQTVPAGKDKQYLAQAPLSGGGAVAVDALGKPAATAVPSLADVATYYWENDLRSDYSNVVSAGTVDPASWQHMTTFTIGMGFDPPTGPQPDGTNGIMPAGTTIPQIIAWAQGLGSAIPGFSWPTPYSDSLYNIADLAHAAVNGRGDFFNVKKPEDLAKALAMAFATIGSRTVAPTTAAVNSSVLSLGALSFSTGYKTGDWTGSFQGVTLNSDGTVDQVLWKAETNLAAYHSSSGYTGRTVWTGSYSTTGGFNAFQFTAANKASMDASEKSGLQTPALAGTDDTLDHRIDYLLGDSTYELTGVYRKRLSILGAILRSAPVYVAGATGNYYDSWPTFGGIAPPETDTLAQSFDAFVTQQSTNDPMVYVGANDGMLHAFHAPVPKCTGTLDVNGNCSSAYTSAAGAGTEAWAFVPRAVYANLGNLTVATDFKFRPTVDATPVRRDVFFGSDKKWHTLLAGGVGLGGRGVYALDITDPATFSASDVLWELDADMAIPASDNCKSIQGSSADGIGCRAADLGYTVSNPNIGRLSNGKWVVLVPNGYFPDCSMPDIPTADAASCQAVAAQAPVDATGKPYSALFVIDAQSGKVIAELKTPTNISGVTSFGLATPVMGDYQNDQVDDVAFAGDVQGNLWRFDLSDTSAANWTVTLVYQGLSAAGYQGVQPITSMPRLFPDPLSNRFIVLFGTGKFLGVGDNSNATVQAIYGVRDVVGKTWTQGDLTEQFLHEELVPAFMPDGVTPNPLAGANLRCVTGGAGDNCSTTATAVNAITGTGSGGWFINLYTTTGGGVHNDAGERVVVNPGAIFASNTVIFQTLITGAQSTDACHPSTQGSILALNATTGGPSGVSVLGGWPIAGARISNARTSGSLPVVSALGGGQAYLPGATILPGIPMSIDAPIWRRRSWQEIREN